MYSPAYSKRTLLLAAATLALAAPAAAQPAPRAGGNLVYAQSSFPPCLDLAQSARAQNATRQALDNLIEQDKATGEPRPWLATSWSFEENGRRIVMKLREGVTFSNGQKFDAAAVKANFDTLVKMGKDGMAPQAGGYLSGHVGAEVIDPMTVALTFEQPKAGLLQSLSEKPLSMLAPETLAKTPEQRCGGQLIATGPFVITQVVTNDRIVLTKRPDYNWASPNASHQGPAWLDSVTFQTVPEGSVRVGILTSGQVGAIDEIPTESLPLVKDSGARIIARTAGGVGITLIANKARPIMTDKAVIAALRHGIDRHEVLKALYSSYDNPSTSVLSQTVPGHVDVSALFKFDPAAAKKALDEGGWVEGPDGMRSKDGKPLRVELIWSFPGFRPDMELIKAQLANIGVDLRLNLRTDTEITQVIRGGRYDLRMSDFTRPDPDVMLGIFSSRFNSLIKAPQPELDTLLDKQSAAMDPAERKALVRQVQEMMVADGYGFPIKEASTILGVRSDVQGLWLSTPRWPVFYDTFIAKGQ
jgi:peptide/nickel transport system substrate-binding protein